VPETNFHVHTESQAGVRTLVCSISRRCRPWFRGATLAARRYSRATPSRVHTVARTHARTAQLQARIEQPDVNQSSGLCDLVWCSRSLATFRSNILPPASRHSQRIFLKRLRPHGVTSRRQ
jgi:hypothetical protein